jgi:hypothetical protein
MEFLNANAQAVQSIAAAVQAIMAVIGVVGIYLLWTQQRDSKKDRREKFYQSLSSSIHSHNWKFIEHWDNPGVRPWIKEALHFQDKEAELGKRVVVLSHVNLLWQVFLHKDHLAESDIDGFRNWSLSWYTSSIDQLKVLFEQGDLYPLDFIYWLKNSIFGEGRFSPLVGPGLDGRISSDRGRTFRRM